MTDESAGDASPSNDQSPSSETTEPIDPARPAEDDAPDSAQPPNGGASDRPDGAGVSIPSWLAAGLVVLLGFVLAGAGFAIGRATAPDDDGGFRRIVATEGGRGGESRTFPIPGGPGGLPGFPGEQGGQGRGGGDDSGGSGPRVFPGGPDRTYPGDDDSGDDDSGDERGSDDGSDSGDDSDTPAPPELPGT